MEMVNERKKNKNTLLLAVHGEKTYGFSPHNFVHFLIFAVVVTTHGRENILYGKDKQYETHRLWEPFTADKCRGLAGKPKLFFVQVSYSANYKVLATEDVGRHFYQSNLFEFTYNRRCF